MTFTFCHSDSLVQIALFSEHAAARRTLLEEVAVAKDESVALSKKNTARVINTDYIKIYLRISR